MRMNKKAFNCYEKVRGISRRAQRSALMEIDRWSKEKAIRRLSRKRIIGNCK
jgi:hypothetical protein